MVQKRAKACHNRVTRSRVPACSMLLGLPRARGEFRVPPDRSDPGVAVCENTASNSAYSPRLIRLCFPTYCTASTCRLFSPSVQGGRSPASAMRN